MVKHFMTYGDYPDLENVKRILVIKMRHLGDVLLTEPVFSNLKKKLPDAKIDAYIWKEAHPMLQGHPAISSFHLYDRGWKKLPFFQKLVQEWKILRAIRRKKYDLVINLTEGDRGAIVAKASKAKIRVGFDPEKKGLFGKKNLYTHVVKHCATPRHTVERNLDCLRRMGIFPELSDRKLHLHIPDEAARSMKKIVESGKFAVIHATSRWQFKCLPPALMAKVVDLLELPVILTGGPSQVEREMVEQICRLSEKKPLNFAGKTSLKELGALFTTCQGLITVDSVALHMASALQVPVVALFGPTSEENWGPWMHPKSVVVSKKISCRPCRLDGCGGSKVSDCLWGLSPQEIAGAFSSLSDGSTETSSASRLFSLNSLEIVKTE